MVSHLEHLFPALQGTAYHRTSPPERRYNCVAWAAGEVRQWWWPDPGGPSYWPPGVERTESLSAFRAAFVSLGFELCSAADQEAGYEKVAVYADAQGFPTHVARQLSNGRWTSKLGELEDIEHDLQALTGREYGGAALLLKRPRVS